MVLWTNAVGPQRTLDEIQMDDVLAVEAYPHQWSALPSVTQPHQGVDDQLILNRVIQRI